MEEQRVCSMCGCILGENEGTELDDDLLCNDCVEQHTVQCDHCGEAVWAEDSVSDERTVLCCSCFDDHYRRCEDCGRMSLLKMINKIRRGKTAMMDLHEYVTAPSKTDNRILNGAKDILSHLPITEMMTVKKLFFKTGGREQIHLVVSLTPDDRNRSDNVYLELASKVAGIFEGFQSYFAVHRDTAIRHMHIVLNSVSIDGHKFSQSKSDLHRLKQKCNDLLGQFGFDPISIRPENLLDSTDYSQRADFEFLEVSEPVMNRNEISLSDEIGPFSGPLDLSSEHYYDWQNQNHFTGGITMRNELSTPQFSVQPETQSYPTEVLPGLGTPLPNHPATPSISLNTGTHYIVRMNESAPASDIAEVVESCGQLTEQQALLAANIAWAIHQKAQAEGQLRTL